FGSNIHAEVVNPGEARFIDYRNHWSAGDGRLAWIVRCGNRKLNRQKIGELAHVAVETEPSAILSSLAFLDGLDFGSRRIGNQLVQAHLPRFVVLLQVEAAGEKVAEHQVQLLLPGRMSCARLDVVLMLVEPIRSDHLAHLQAVCFRYEAAQRDILPAE